MKVGKIEAARQNNPMRVLVNFLHRSGWSIHCLEEDCATPIGQPVTVATDEMLIRLMKASGAGPVELDEISRDMRRWGRGSTPIDVSDVGKRLLRIK
jgi:hypothetical protein